MSKRLYFLIVLYLSTSCFHERVETDSFVPAWFEVGVYAQYKLNGTTSIDFVNESHYRFQPVTAFFRWKVVEFDGHVALLDVSFTSEQETIIESPGARTGESLKLNLTTSVYVDVGSRDVWSLDNELLGKTGFWLPSHPEKGDKIVVFGKAGNYLNGTIKDIGFTTSTPQGSQPIFVVEVEWHEGPSLWFPYDLTTGLLFNGRQLEGIDAMFLALNISYVDMHYYLDSTNIDLGPPSFKFFIIMTLFKATPVVTFIIVALIVYKRWKRKPLL